MSFIASTIHPARRIGGVRAERYVFEGSLERWKDVFETAEKRLERRDWAVGRFSIADIRLFGLYWRSSSQHTPLRRLSPVCPLIMIG